VLVWDGGTADLAGRVGELQAVSELLSGETKHAAMLIMGEAAVGKSRLVAAAADAVAETGVLVVTGWCLPLSGGVPFLPVVDVLAGLANLDDGQLLIDALSDSPKFVRAELSRLLPDLSDASDQDPGPGRRPVVTADDCHEQHADSTAELIPGA
jgi:predicted ATPase